MGSMSIWHWLVLLAIILLVFGTGRLSAVMGDAAKGIKAFKKGMADDDAPATRLPEVAAVQPPVPGYAPSAGGYAPAPAPGTSPAAAPVTPPPYDAPAR